VGPGERGFLALGLVVIGVTTLFLVLVAVALLLRRPAPDWRAAAVELPLVRLGLGTLALVASSASFERAARRPGRARRELVLGLLAGAGFLGLQGWLWLALVAAGQAPAAGGYLAVLYVLTGLHALHVLGGLGFLARLACLAQPPASTLRLAALYWHFMGFLWVVVLALLVFGR
jgi:cytochrome c oxidase subunit 3